MRQYIVGATAILAGVTAAVSVSRTPDPLLRTLVFAGGALTILGGIAQMSHDPEAR